MLYLDAAKGPVGPLITQLICQLRQGIEQVAINHRH